MTKKTYADECLVRVEASNDIPAHTLKYLQAKIESSDDVPELARRLKRACETFRAMHFKHPNHRFDMLADELEADPSALTNPAALDALEEK